MDGQMAIERNHRANEAERDDLVAGRNPVIELLKSERPVDKILMIRAERDGGSLSKIRAMARERGVPVKDAAKEKLDQLCPGLSHQGVAAFCAAYAYAEIEDICRRAGEEPLFVVLADGIEDPHNLGAIIRSADAAGAHGVIVPRRGGAGLTAAVMRASAGAAGHLPVARVPNLTAAIRELKRKNVWVYAADFGGQDWCTVNFDGAVALVVGGEDRGVSRLVRETCDGTVSLPMRGAVGSLNASVAAGIVLYEIARQRLGIKAR